MHTMHTRENGPDGQGDGDLPHHALAGRMAIKCWHAVSN